MTRKDQFVLMVQTAYLSHISENGLGHWADRAALSGSVIINDACNWYINIPAHEGLWTYASEMVRAHFGEDVKGDWMGSKTDSPIRIVLKGKPCSP